MKIGYLRVSTEEQRPDRQIDALTPICDELHVEKLSAVAKPRPVYEKIINSLNSGDIFVIWDLDRAYRSAKDALNELDNLRERGIEIQIASIDIDTSTPHGMLIYTFISGLAEFERRLLSERTKQGLRYVNDGWLFRMAGRAGCSVGDFDRTNRHTWKSVC